MELLIAGLISVFASFIKKYIKPKFGDLGMHGIIFIIAFGFVIIADYIGKNPSLLALWKQAVIYLTLAIAEYELILKKFPILKGK